MTTSATAAALGRGRLRGDPGPGVLRARTPGAGPAGPPARPRARRPRRPCRSAPRSPFSTSSGTSWTTTASGGDRCEQLLGPLGRPAGGRSPRAAAWRPSSPNTRRASAARSSAPSAASTSGPNCGDDLGEARGARLDHLAGDPVSVDEHGAVGREQAGHLALAGPDPAGEPDRQHGSKRRRRTCCGPAPGGVRGRSQPIRWIRTRRSASRAARPAPRRRRGCRRPPRCRRCPRRSRRTAPRRWPRRRLRGPPRPASCAPPSAPAPRRTAPPTRRCCVS